MLLIYFCIKEILEPNIAESTILYKIIYLPKYLIFNIMISNRTIVLLFLLSISFLSYSQTYYTSYIKLIKGSQTTSQGVADDVVKVDEKNNKITISNPNPKYQTYILKIKNKKPALATNDEGEIFESKEETIYTCELVNNNGTIAVDIFIDTFFQTISMQAKYASEYTKWNYSKVVE